MSSARTIRPKYQRHGHGGTPTHNSWRAMLDRCFRPKHHQHQDYGGRGISVCPRWQESFLNFLQDMGPRPAGTTLERRDSNQDYSPSNCYWATRKEQNRNKRSNRLLTFQGSTLSLSAWAEKVGLKAHTLAARLDLYGWTLERALSTPMGASHLGHRLVTINGVTRNMTEWCRRYGISTNSVAQRLRQGWDPTKAITSPKQPGRRRI